LCISLCISVQLTINVLAVVCAIGAVFGAAGGCLSLSAQEKQALTDSASLARSLEHSPEHLIHVHHPEHLYTLSQHVFVLEDASRVKTLHDIRRLFAQGAFQRSVQPVPNYGISSSAIWMRFTVHNHTNDKCFLQIYNGPLDSVEIFVLPASSLQPHQWSVGDTSAQVLCYKLRGAAAPGKRDFAMTYNIIELEDMGSQPCEVYVRVTTFGAMYLASDVGATPAIARAVLYYSWFNALAFGIVGILIVYNAFLFVVIRDKAYLLYVLHYLGVLGFFLYQKGVIGFLIGDEVASVIMRTAGTTQLLTLGTSVLMCLFAISFLHLREYSPWWRQILLGLACVDGLVIVGSLLDIEFVRKSLTFVALPTLLAVLVSGIVARWRGYKPARFFLIGWTAWIGCTMLYSMMAQNVITTTRLMEFILQLGACVDGVLMSFALADRITTLRREREQALRDKERLMREQNDALERSVHERTEELERANSQLTLVNHQLTVLNQDKNDILHIVAHDLQNPLTTIVNLSQMLESSSLSEQQRRSFNDHIGLAAQRMHTLIKHTLDVNTIEAGKITVLKMPIDIVPLAIMTLRQHENKAAAKNIALLYEGESQAVALVDEALVCQTLDNLLSNALKFSPNHTTVTLRVLHTRRSTQGEHSASAVFSDGQVSGEPEQNSVFIEITDQGPGISDADQAHLFKKFTRLSAKPTGGEH